jgi:hypothetical protein
MMTTPDLDDRVRKALEHGRPTVVKDVRVLHGADWSGEPAVWLWLIVDDLTDAASNELETARTWAEGAAKPAAGERWIYVSFRTESEQVELEKQQ